jgi:hypothetical protein
MGGNPRGATGGGGFSTGNTGTSSMAPRHYSFGRTDYSGIQGMKLTGPQHASAVEGLFGIAPGSLGGGGVNGSAAPKGPPPTAVANLPGNIKQTYYTDINNMPAGGGLMRPPVAPAGSGGPMPGAGLNWVVPPPPPPRQQLATQMARSNYRRRGGSGSNYGDRSGSTTSGGRGGFGGSSARSGGLY